MVTIPGTPPFALNHTPRHGANPFSFAMGCAFVVLSSIRRILCGCMRAAEVLPLRSRPQGAILPPYTGSQGARWPPKGASREAGGISCSSTEACPAATFGHPTTTLTVRHTYIMEVCKTPDATTLTVHHTYIMRAMSPGSQAVTNTSRGSFPKPEATFCQQRATLPPMGGGQTGSPQRFSNMAKICQGFRPEGARWNESFTPDPPETDLCRTPL